MVADVIVQLVLFLLPFLLLLSSAQSSGWVWYLLLRNNPPNKNHYWISHEVKAIVQKRHFRPTETLSADQDNRREFVRLLDSQRHTGGGLACTLDRVVMAAGHEQLTDAAQRLFLLLVPSGHYHPAHPDPPMSPSALNDYSDQPAPWRRMHHCTNRFILGLGMFASTQRLQQANMADAQLVAIEAEANSHQLPVEKADLLEQQMRSITSWEPCFQFCTKITK